MRVGVAIGREILKNTWRYEHPSILAASSHSLGTCSNIGVDNHIIVDNVMIKYVIINEM